MSKIAMTTTSGLPLDMPVVEKTKIIQKAMRALPWSPGFKLYLDAIGASPKERAHLKKAIASTYRAIDIANV